jgi:aspartate racemase
MEKVRGRVGVVRKRGGSMWHHNAIGIIGGVGPYAGLDLNRKIFDQTIAKTDQDHLNVILISAAEIIPDRTEYLLGIVKENPAKPMLDVLLHLEAIGVDVVGIPCNTAHAPEIFNTLVKGLKEKNDRIQVMHMIKEVAAFLKEYGPKFRNVGVLATNGTVTCNVYGRILKAEGYAVLYPDEEIQHEEVHAAIYDKAFGVKAKSNPVTTTARAKIMRGIYNLVEKNADCIVLGCTELPLVIEEQSVLGRAVIDPTLILARALIREVDPDKLRAMEGLDIGE